MKDPAKSIDSQQNICVEIGSRSINDVFAEIGSRRAVVMVDGIGRLSEVLSHPGFDELQRVEIREYFDLTDADVIAIASRGRFHPIKVIHIGDSGSSISPIVELMAKLPEAGHLEEMVLYWDTYMGRNLSLVKAREDEINEKVGRLICRVDPSN